MNNIRLKDLLTRFSSSQLTDSEMKELTEWYDSIDFGSEKYEALIKEAGGEGQLIDRLFEKLVNKINHDL